ncbi:hypothetical protein MWH25_09890 [Natroniella acetigena]|uniref:hypothetical protein n=1 Tax=Natroniella acetigena TaxID=52004 RepID=UPI00200B49A0|nr:hypothetical protein [Natroniella acetigena]MCK8828048.1 hypothetical protein [Natroniella acetigena]
MALLITGLVYARRQLDFRGKVLFHPIVLAPLVGSLLGSEGFSTGITIGVIVELIWGSNLVDYNAGFKYGLLVSLLAVTLTILSGNISLVLNLSLVVILSFAFQETFEFLEGTKYFVLVLLMFNLLILFSVPVVQGLLGATPVQFLSELSIIAGLFPVVGLAIFLIQGLKPLFHRDNIWYYSYALATIITSILVYNNYYWGLLLFPIVWYGLYYLWNRTNILELKDYFRFALIGLVVLTTPLILNFNSLYSTSNLQHILWAEALLAVFAVLRLFKLTGIEGYFILALVGIVGARLGIFI